MAIDNLQATASRRTRSMDRWLFPLGWALVVAGVAIYCVQFFALKQYVVPWYAALLGTVGAVAMLIAVCRRWTILRIVGLTLCALLVAGEWFFLLSLSRVPPMPVWEEGQKVPAFAASRADGTTFTDRQLAGQPTVLLFFRGHW
jgi:hypothetical protein